MRRLDILGKRFGRLVVKEFSHKNGKTHWICVCDCGKTTKPILGGNLNKKGGTSSCGCLRNETSKKNAIKGADKKIKNITEQQFGYLTAKNRTTKRIHRRVVWACECICGKYHEATHSDLVTGEVTSCGCRVISNLHEKTKQVLLTLGIEIIQEEYPLYQNVFSFDNRTSVLHIDILICHKDIFLAIECQGRQHYQPVTFWGGEDTYKKTVERDGLKKACLKAVNIPLIEVRYDERDIEGFLRTIS